MGHDQPTFDQTRLLNYDSEGWPVVTDERFNATAYFNQS